jgi:tRNA-binding protein
MELIEYSDFEKIDLRVGTITEVSTFPKARNPSYKIMVDLGEGGIKKSSAQITDLYSADDLLGKQVVVVYNFSPRQIADFMSEVLILGVIGGSGGVVLLSTEREVKNGHRVA